MKYSKSERIGVNAVEKIFLDDLDWIPRNIFQSDIGIDMVVEVSQEGTPVGKFFGIQIKAGPSYFKRQTETHVPFSTDHSHIDYWLKNSLPIILVLHNPDTNQTIWEFVDLKTVVKTGKQWRIDVPINKILNVDSAEELLEYDKSPRIIQQFQRLILDRRIIKLVQDEFKIIMEIDVRTSKLHGRADIRIIKIVQTDELTLHGDDEYETEEILFSEFSLTGLHRITALTKLYPWANFEIDEYFYDMYDSEDDESNDPHKIYFFESEYNDSVAIVPYASDGEVDSYRLIMTLNEFGKSFIDFYSFLSVGKQLKIWSK
jgi:hypothetical protein